LPKKRIDDALAKAWAARLATLPPLAEATDEQLADLAESPAASVKLLRGSAAELTRRAKELELLAADVHVAGIAGELAAEMKKPEAKIDLLRAALLIARLDDDEVEIEPYLEQVDGMAGEIRAALAKDADEPTRLAALNKFLFEQNGFHGSRTDYYHRANSYLSRVIDDREGLPITLSVLYMELGRRLDLNFVGVGLPAHFVVRHEPTAGEPQLIDVFEGGKPLTRDDADKLVRELTGEPLAEEFLAAQSKQQIIRRILQNLLGIAQRDESRESMLRYVEAAVALDEADLQSRGLRAILRYQTGRRAAALTDLDWFLKTKPEGIDLDQIRAMREQFATGTP
jgi:regulator of sirC expression with transglutaminase-like and TPR domain